MKQAELMQHATCTLCRQKIGHTGLPLFWTVRIERFGIDVHAVRRQDGLAALIGHPGIAAAMGPDETMAKPMMDPVTLTVCETCAIHGPPIAWLAEHGRTSNECSAHGLR